MKPILKKVSKQAETSFLYKNEKFQYFPAPYHFHPEIEIILISKSSGVRIIGNNIERFYPDDLIIIGDSLPHIYINDAKYYNAIGKLNAHAIAIQFSKTFAGEGFIKLPEFEKCFTVLHHAQYGIQITGEIKTTIVSIMRKMEKMNEQERFIHFIKILFLIGNLKKINTLVSPDFLTTINWQDKQKMNTLFNYIFNNFRHNITLENAANLLNMNKQAFCRYFKTRIGKTFSLFINELRINYVCELLLENNLTITQAAFESGFENLSYFNRQFKKIKSTTPRKYKREVLEYMKFQNFV
jgi:YesN/AraC family two-component response regulator